MPKETDKVLEDVLGWAKGIALASGAETLDADHLLLGAIKCREKTDAYTHRIGRTGRAAKTGDAFTFVCREDEPLIKGIERVLGERIERRLLKNFDYKKTAPVRDVEFARPPREPQRRRTQPKTAQAPARTGTLPHPKKH